ncbi:MAG TPA: cupredoxin family copper-binding protein [Pyrinomonadaceae bacterium]|nr:cupredoxin family copper-binding protein [Pyrinomonadaceae bacterium]
MLETFGRRIRLNAAASLLAACAACGGAGLGAGSSAAPSSQTPNAAHATDVAGVNQTTQAARGDAKQNSKTDTKPDAGADAAQNQIVIENFTFKPATLTVKAGTKVTWVNRDDVPHTATDTDKRFNSGALDTDDRFSFTFEKPGTYDYFCALHPKMTGRIVVK